MNRLQINTFLEEGLIEIKLSSSYKERIGEIITCFSKVKVGSIIKKRTQLFSFETTRCLASIDAPCDGTVIDFGEEIFDFPENITSETTLIYIKPISEKLLHEMSCL